jgi:hypothetical protein
MLIIYFILSDFDLCDPPGARSPPPAHWVSTYDDDDDDDDDDSYGTIGRYNRR